jgi:heme/copper-type cytochrome/quinol oxidase subunit 2
LCSEIVIYMSSCYSKSWLLLAAAPLVIISFLSLAEYALAQESPENYIVRRVEIWGVFYRLMVIAFVVGAVVQGSIVYIIWRFRESNKKNQPRGSMESVHH